MERLCFALIFGIALQLSLAAADEANEVPDSFLMFSKFPFAVAITDSDNDTIFECVTAKRAWFNMDTKRGEYIWLLKGHDGKPQKTIAFYVAEGKSPDTFLYMEGSEDAQPEIGTFYYTDYENCGVIDMPYHGRQCALWASETGKDSLPQRCLEEFSKHCGVGTPKYSKDICSDEEIMYW
ncbi:uncharacterized protein LOC144097411 [Amblyomma americanum]